MSGSSTAELIPQSLLIAQSDRSGIVFLVFKFSGIFFTDPFLNYLDLENSSRPLTR